MRVGRRFIQSTVNPAIAAVFVGGRGVTTIGSGSPVGSGAQLSWSAPTLGEDGNAASTITSYVLYASTSSEDWVMGTFLTPINTGSAATNYTWNDPAFAAGTRWYFWVRALNAGGALSQPTQFATKTF